MVSNIKDSHGVLSRLFGKKQKNDLPFVMSKRELRKAKRETITKMSAEASYRRTMTEQTETDRLLNLLSARVERKIKYSPLFNFARKK